jgi:hypothetical protein
MRKTFVIRGKTADFKTTGATEILNFGKYKAGYAYKMTEFTLFPSTNIISQSLEMCGTITVGKTPLDPENPDFNNDALIASALMKNDQSQTIPFTGSKSVVNDTFVITQNLILTVTDSYSNPVNWQCRFESVKMSGPEEASVNYKQFAISDE